jgi:hypothetical protein
MDKDASIADLCEKIDAMMKEMKNISNAFIRNVDGSIDYDGHRKYHDAIVQAANAQEKFWVELKLDLAKKGLWFVLLVIIGFVVLGIQTKLGLYK